MSLCDASWFCAQMESLGAVQSWVDLEFVSQQKQSSELVALCCGVGRPSTDMARLFRCLIEKNPTNSAVFALARLPYKPGERLNPWDESTHVVLVGWSPAAYANPTNADAFRQVQSAIAERRRVLMKQGIKVTSSYLPKLTEGMSGMCLKSLTDAVHRRHGYADTSSLTLVPRVIDRGLEHVDRHVLYTGKLFQLQNLPAERSKTGVADLCLGGSGSEYRVVQGPTKGNKFCGSFNSKGWIDVGSYWVACGEDEAGGGVYENMSFRDGKATGRGVWSCANDLHIAPSSEGVLMSFDKMFVRFLDVLRGSGMENMSPPTKNSSSPLDHPRPLHYTGGFSGGLFHGFGILTRKLGGDMMVEEMFSGEFVQGKPRSGLFTRFGKDGKNQLKASCRLKPSGRIVASPQKTREVTGQKGFISFSGRKMKVCYSGSIEDKVVDDDEFLVPHGKGNFEVLEVVEDLKKEGGEEKGENVVFSSSLRSFCFVGCKYDGSFCCGLAEDWEWGVLECPAMKRRLKGIFRNGLLMEGREFLMRSGGTNGTGEDCLLFSGGFDVNMMRSGKDCCVFREDSGEVLFEGEFVAGKKSGPGKYVLSRDDEPRTVVECQFLNDELMPKTLGKLECLGDETSSSTPLVSYLPLTRCSGDRVPVLSGDGLMVVGGKRYTTRWVDGVLVSMREGMMIGGGILPTTPLAVGGGGAEALANFLGGVNERQRDSYSRFDYVIVQPKELHPLRGSNIFSVRIGGTPEIEVEALHSATSHNCALYFREQDYHWMHIFRNDFVVRKKKPQGLEEKRHFEYMLVEVSEGEELKNLSLRGATGYQLDDLSKIACFRIAFGDSAEQLYNLSLVTVVNATTVDSFRTHPLLEGPVVTTENPCLFSELAILIQSLTLRFFLPFAQIVNNADVLKQEDNIACFKFARKVHAAFDYRMKVSSSSSSRKDEEEKQHWSLLSELQICSSVHQIFFRWRSRAWDAITSDEGKNALEIFLHYFQSWIEDGVNVVGLISGLTNEHYFRGKKLLENYKAAHQQSLHQQGADALQKSAVFDSGSDLMRAGRLLLDFLKECQSLMYKGSEGGVRDLSWFQMACSLKPTVRCVAFDKDYVDGLLGVEEMAQRNLSSSAVEMKEDEKKRTKKPEEELKKERTVEKEELQKGEEEKMEINVALTRSEILWREESGGAPAKLEILDMSSEEGKRL